METENTVKTEQTMKVNLTLDRIFYDQIKSMADKRYLKVATYIKQQLKYALANTAVRTQDTDDHNLMFNPLNNDKC